MELKQALRAGANIRLALVGSGGKTTALFCLARQLAGPVLVSTSTHLSEDQLRMADRHWVIRESRQIAALREEILSTHISLLTGPKIEAARTRGLGAEFLADLYQFAEENRLPILVEADGSRRLPIKAPAEHEPAIPPWVNTVAVVCGLSGLGNPIDSEHVHRFERFANLTGLEPGMPVNVEAIAAYLVHPSGGLKNIPEGARKVAILNQVDGSELQQQAEEIARRIIATYDGVIIASLGLQGNPVYRVVEPTAAIILAAGGSVRFQQPKVLLNWQGKPFVRVASETALKAGLNPVIVITGRLDVQIREALAGLPIQIVHNPDWESGQSSSLRAGINNLPEQIGAAIFLLADQPQIPASILAQLADMHQRTMSAIIAPEVAGKRANPVLFDRQTFADLLALQGDVGGRAVMNRYPLLWLPSNDPRLTMDIDTPEDYQTLINSGWDNE